jgi:hypothetical protein
MGLLKFFSSIGTVGLTSWNAAIAYKGYKGTCIVPDDLSTADQTTIDRIVMGVAVRSQSFKPRSKELKEIILRELSETDPKSLILYCCYCLKYESSATDIDGKTWMVWIDVIDEKLIKGGVPKELRYGYAVKDRFAIQVKFWKREYALQSRNDVTGLKFSSHPKSQSDRRD